MTLSIWRYSHMALALAVSIFLFIAAVTGVVLALEPIAHQAKDYKVLDIKAVSLSTAIEALEQRYDDVLSLEVESSGFVKASVITSEFETLDVYIDPLNGQSLGPVGERPAIFSFATNLHRSLFLKSPGRIFVGLVSLLLVLIAFTGVFLLAKRQGGFRRLFARVQPDYFEMRYHVILSRWFFIPVVLVALTGAYLSAEKFGLLPDPSPADGPVNFATSTDQYGEIADIPFFRETNLDEVRSVNFPFSDEPGDYFEVALKEREVWIDQHSGAVLRSVKYPFVQLLTRWNWVLHTGEGSVLWSLVLGLSSMSILFFMYSGFAMTWRRRKKVKSPSKMPGRDEAEFVILFGSETGTTYDFAYRLFKSLDYLGKKVYLTELNDYSTFSRAKHVFILAATYGEGEPTTNARKFEAVFPDIPQPNNPLFSVVGFGSLEYPDYCGFAVKVDALLREYSDFKCTLPLYKIDRASFTAFENWAGEWGEKTGIPLKLEPPVSKKKKYGKCRFKVVERSAVNRDDTFLLRLRPGRRIPFVSGDLLNILPADSGQARQYSIAKMGPEILLSIKKHELGRVSPYLSGLNPGDTLSGFITPNPHFHFPKKTKSAIFIANGTGLAPFLGMMAENKTTPVTLFWGGRTRESAELYHPVLSNGISKRPETSLIHCYSREGAGEYVQDRIARHKALILGTLDQGGVILICGSLSMQHSVLEVLERLVKAHTSHTLDRYQRNGQLKMDCY